MKLTTDQKIDLYNDYLDGYGKTYLAEKYKIHISGVDYLIIGLFLIGNIR